MKIHTNPLLNAAAVLLVFQTGCTSFLPGNRQPISFAGYDQHTRTNIQVDLDGEASFDPDGDSLTYNWAVDSTPKGAQFSLSNHTKPVASFQSGTPGLYVLRLVVGDGSSKSVPDFVNVTVLPGENNPPIADAGADKSAKPGSLVLLDGSGSSDADGDTLTYSWSFDSKPATSNLKDTDIQPNNSESAAKPSFIPDAEGEYVITLEVNDNRGGSDTDSVTVTVSSAANNPPIADAGVDFSVTVDKTADLDGSASYDPDGDTLTYVWSFSKVPAGSLLLDTNIQSRTSPLASFKPDNPGDYILSLTVNDGKDGDQDEVTVTAVPAGNNRTPTADAGVDIEVHKGQEAKLDGTASYDPDSDVLVYNWTIVSKPQASNITTSSIIPNNSTGASTASFIPDRGGVYIVGLMVDDQKGGTSFDQVNVTAKNNPPQADAGGPYSVLNFHEIELNGSATDPEGDPITYHWSFSSLPQGSSLDDSDIQDNNKSTARFTPDKKGTYLLLLTATDWDAASASDTAQVESLNNPPVADISGPDTASPGDKVDLDGSGSSDPDNDTLTYSWSFKDLPLSSLLGDRDIQGRFEAHASFTPDVEGSYTLELLVQDPDNASDSKQIIVQVIQDLAITTSSSDLKPARECIDYTFDGLQAVGGTSPYAFSKVSGDLPLQLQLLSNGIIQGRPDPGTANTYTFTARVTDHDNATADRSLDLIVLPNRDPTADAGNNVSGPNLSQLVLDGSGSSDPDANPLTYSWSLVSKPTGSTITDSNLVGSDSTHCSFFPDKKGDYVLELALTDGCGGSSSAQVTATALNNAPKALVVAPASAETGNRVDLDGTGSSDPDGDTIGYAWEFAAKPTDSILDGSDINGANASRAWFIPDVAGTFTLRLTVNDNDGGTDSQNVDIVVTPPALQIVTNSTDLPQARECVDYGSYSLQATGGVSPYSWTEAGNNLAPAGLMLDSSGVLHGIPYKATAGALAFTASVTDQQPDTVQKDLQITILSNRDPLANAGQDTSVLNLHEIALSGSASDPDGNPLAYIWSFAARPQGSSLSNTDINGRDTLIPRFTPDVKGVFTLDLEVRDGCNGVAHDAVSVNSMNNPPIADAGNNQNLIANATLTPVHLDGTGSTDQDGDQLSYSWSISGVHVADGANPTIRLPVGTWDITLTVDDGDGGTDQDTVKIDISENGAGQSAAYVSQSSGSDDSNPCTRTQPCLTITRGLARASELTGVNGFITGVLTAGGEYNETFQIPADASLFCGYNPGSWLLDPNNFPTNVYTDQNNGFTFAPGVTRDVEVRGCIFHGNDAGGGNTTAYTVRMDSASPTFAGNGIITGQASYLRGLFISGGAASPLVEWNTIIGGNVRDRRFYDDENGQAVLVENGATPVIRHNHIVGPSCDNGGRWRQNIHCDGILIKGVTVAQDNNPVIIDSNQITGGDTCGMPCTGLGLDSSTAIVINNIIHGGDSEDTCGLGFFLPESNESLDPVVFHNVILAGSASAFSSSICLWSDSNSDEPIGRLQLISNVLTHGAYGIYEFAPRLEPSIVWNNDFDSTSLDSLYNDSTSQGDQDRNLTWINNHFGSAVRPARNIDDNPDFVNPDWSNIVNGDWHLDNRSACIDSGAPETIDGNPEILDVKKDFEGDSRAEDGHPDIGADEKK
ncbi:MAG: PKD domain-containing protein [Deltaproteobacteria bacterium]|nr:PKD domain-containing protein [Deltaproteobacteria bacterium]